MLHTLAATSPAVAITGCAVIALLAVCATAIVSSALRTARPEDVPQIIAILCKALRRRRR